MSKAKLLAMSALIGLSIIATGVSPKVFAASSPWYTGYNPSAGYLSSHMLQGAISADLETTTAGEYCNYYNTGINLLTQTPTDVHSVTGFDPGATYSDWQQGDISAANVCQAKNGTFGFKLSGAANNNCSAPAPAPCGMQHFVRLSNGSNNLPWSSSFGTVPSPALTFSLTTKPQTATGGSTFGYFCPILKDTAATTTPKYIEYCFVEWRSTSAFPSSFPAISQYDDLGACQSTQSPYTPADVDIIFTAFQNGLNWGTHRSGSGGTFTFTPTTANLAASISKTNLQNVITRLNTSVSGGGCNRGLSTDVGNYALIGYEQGVEGAGFSSLGSSVSNVQLSTTTDTLFPGETLSSGQTMYSSTGGDRLVMQGDGNLVVYDSSNNWKWQSYTNGHNGAFLKMLTDGRLVIYEANGTTDIWIRPSSGYVAGSYAIIQGDANFVVYNGNQAKWAGGILH